MPTFLLRPYSCCEQTGKEADRIPIQNLSPLCVVRIQPEAWNERTGRDWREPQAESPTTAQGLHHFLYESGLRVTMRLKASDLLAAHSLVPRTSNTTGQMSVGVLKLCMGGRSRSRRLHTPALAFRRHSAGGVWTLASLPSSCFGWRWGRGLRGV